MKKVIYTLGAFLPVVAYAQGAGVQTGALEEIVDFIGTTIQALIPIAFGLAIVFFFYGLAKFIRSAGDPKAQAEGKGIMIYGVIAIAVMLSVYGLADWLRELFGIGDMTTAEIPNVQIP